MTNDGRNKSIKSEIMLKASSAWNGIPYTPYGSGDPELTVLRIKIPAGAKLPWHIHPHPNAAYIISGQVTIEERNGKAETFTAGQVVPETIEAEHMGTAGDTPVEVIAFYAGIKGTPISVPVGQTASGRQASIPDKVLMQGNW
jgi:quercetin dioxygenase-like cupin family protein